MKISEIAQVSSGYHFRGSVDAAPEGDLPVIQAKDIGEDLRFNAQALRRVRLEGNSERYRVQPGDVLFLSRGHRLWAIVVENVVPGTIAPSYMFIVRPDRSKVRPEYLAWFLNHSKTRLALKGLSSGSGMPFVSLAAFSGVEIPIPQLPTQEKIVELSGLSLEEQKLMRVLAVRRKEMIDRVCMDMANESKQ